MDAFEDLVARLLRREHYWTRQNFKVQLTKAEKVALGKPSLPRPDIDILGYQPVDNRILWVECKSYLDSGGVHIAAFDGSNQKFAERFKVFTDAHYREVVTAALLRDLRTAKLVRDGATVEYWLVAGRIAAGNDALLAAHFAANGWTLRDRNWIRATLGTLAGDGYEDDVVTMAAKLLRN